MRRVLTIGAIVAMLFAAFATPAQAASYDREPKCVKTGFLWLKTNCDARNLYLGVAKKTVRADKTSVQAAYLMVGAGHGKNTLGRMEEMARVIKPGTARCARTELLRFISANSSSMRLTGNIDRAFAAAATATGSKLLKSPQGAMAKQVLKAGRSLVKSAGGALTLKHASNLENAVSSCATGF